MRERQQKLKQPTGYDRLCLGKTREERAQLDGFNETLVSVPIEVLRLAHDRGIKVIADLVWTAEGGLQQEGVWSNQPE